MMDASASLKSKADPNQLYGYFLLQEPSFPTAIKSKNTVIKYTKLPGFDFDSQVSWPQQSYTLQPRLRRIISLSNDSDFVSSRSLEPELLLPQKTVTSNITRRKIVTISEDDENDRHPRFCKVLKRPNSVKTLNKSIEAKKEDHEHSSRLNTSKSTKEIKSSAKTNNTYNNHKKEVSNLKLSYNEKRSNISNICPDSYKARNMKEKDTTRTSKSANAQSKISLSKKFVTSSESDKELNIKNKLSEGTKNSITLKKTVERKQTYKLQNKTVLKEVKNKNSPITVIHVPLDEKYQNKIIAPDKSVNIICDLEKIPEQRDCGSSTEIENPIIFKDVNIGTDLLPMAVDQMTQMDQLDFETVCKCVESLDTQTEIIKETYDSLEIPNVTLIKDKSETKDELFNLSSKSLPDLQEHTLKLSSSKGSNKENVFSDAGYCKSASYVLRRAILTYTTRQKIDLHVFGSKDKINSNQLSSPLSYPMNVVSVFKAEMKKNESQGLKQDKDKSNVQYTNCTNEQKSLNCSYVFNRDKLMKPSDIISTISGSSCLLQSDYICEQFQKELNFIDSFFESLQYLESCSLSEKCLTDDKVSDDVCDGTLNEKNPDYSTLLSKFENGANISDPETMASKSLCMLNLLIRDEQRRAKNLLFVLKMREEALKDFTKSQILWLEKKKKQDNTDISTLKKKQRGALLKLQHECGEMQRIRKALLTLSEKRKVALMKTKMNIELKLKNNVDVDQIILGKKKLKRSTSLERSVTPVKCFDLSSSGCEESSTSRSVSEGVLLAQNVATVTSAEKCIQTGDSILGTVLVDQSTDIAAENFIVVDGGYLNILFQNLSLPHIFSSGKQYEVNEEALKNIVLSANNHNSNLNDSGVVGRLMDQIKNCDLDSSSSVSTARSLIDEYDQYYKNLGEEKSNDQTEETIENVQEFEKNTEHIRVPFTITENVIEELSVEQIVGDGAVCVNDDEEPTVVTSQVGPLPVPAGATATPQTTTAADLPVTWMLSKTSTTLANCPSNSESSHSSSSRTLSVSSVCSLTSPVHSEAEELRRQQLAIEREIKALEQQQCQLLVVREIPDKPPPPYTPPTSSRTPLPPRPFQADEETLQKLSHIHNSKSASFDPSDPFDMFLKDYCEDTIEKYQSELSNDPWDACNLLPQKQLPDGETLLKNTSEELKEILAGVPTTVTSGVGARRSDHIDDILFAEWRCCEPEWTSLHTDEAIVKNQIFESLFQKILTDTIDEYKKTVLCKSDTE